MRERFSDIRALFLARLQITANECFTIEISAKNINSSGKYLLRAMAWILHFRAGMCVTLQLMASLANISSLHVGYYEGLVKIFPFSKSLPFGQKLFHVHFHHSCLLSLSVFLHCSQGWQKRSCPTTAHPRRRLGTHKEEERAFKVFKVFKVSHTACQGEDEGNEED